MPRLLSVIFFPAFFFRPAVFILFFCQWLHIVCFSGRPSFYFYVCQWLHIVFVSGRPSFYFCQWLHIVFLSGLWFCFSPAGFIFSGFRLLPCESPCAFDGDRSSIINDRSSIINDRSSMICGYQGSQGGVPGIPGGYHGALGGYQGPRGGPLGHQRASGIPIGLGDPNGPRGSPGSIEVGVLGLKNGRGGGGVCVIQMLELYLKWEGGGRKEEGGRTGFEIKSNNPNLKGGGKKNEKSLF